LSVIFLGILGLTLAITTLFGIGTWGLNKTVQWGWDITNFVFWVGIGHAGTLISAILLLFRQKWRMSINRSAEAMTIFAVMCAAVFPLFHMGRIWVGVLGITTSKCFWFFVGKLPLTIIVGRISRSQHISRFHWCFGT
jgi:Ni/Fe-hydrogenase subunit HybB-like protein